MLERSIVPIEISAQIDRLKEGGLISHALSGPERRMDSMIASHLERVAILQARGDTVPERPMYIFNPDSRLLINYSLRRDANPARSGLFAEVVELDEKGKPRHGVGVVNPFKTNTGFIHVAVGDNPHGFAPSSVETKIDSDNPLSMIPPNIAIADLLVMLSMEPIAENEKLEEFLSRTNDKRAELRRKAEPRHISSYSVANNRQGLTSQTNHYLNLIISDRDPAVLQFASREAGFFPIHMTVNQLLDIYRHIGTHRYRSAPPGVYVKNNVESLFLIKGQDGEWLPVEKLSDPIPGIITFDYYESTDTPRIIPNPLNPKQTTNRLAETNYIVDGLLDNNPIFANLRNSYGSGSDNIEILKHAHGNYIQPIDPANPEKMKEYADWMRKIRLDLALTLYFRGLSEVV